MDGSTPTGATTLPLAERRRRLVLAASALGLVALVAPPWAAGLLTVILVLSAPGTAVVRLIGLPRGLLSFVVVVACGVAITELSNMMLMSLRVWSWETASVVIMSASVALALVPMPNPVDPSDGS